MEQITKDKKVGLDRFPRTLLIALLDAPWISNIPCPNNLLPSDISLHHGIYTIKSLS